MTFDSEDVSASKHRSPGPPPVLTVLGGGDTMPLNIPRRFRIPNASGSSQARRAYVRASIPRRCLRVQDGNKRISQPSLTEQQLNFHGLNGLQ